MNVSTWRGSRSWRRGGRCVYLSIYLSIYLPGEGAGHGDGVAGAGVHGVVPGHHAVLLRHRVSVLWIKIDKINA